MTDDPRVAHLMTVADLDDMMNDAALSSPANAAVVAVLANGVAAVDAFFDDTYDPGALHVERTSAAELVVEEGERCAEVARVWLAHQARQLSEPFAELTPGAVVVSDDLESHSELFQARWVVQHDHAVRLDEVLEIPAACLAPVLFFQSPSPVGFAEHASDLAVFVASVASSVGCLCEMVVTGSIDDELQVRAAVDLEHKLDAAVHESFKQVLVPASHRFTQGQVGELTVWCAADVHQAACALLDAASGRPARTSEPTSAPQNRRIEPNAYEPIDVRFVLNLAGVTLATSALPVALVSIPVALVLAGLAVPLTVAGFPPRR